MIEHEDGWRGEHGYPQAFYLDGEQRGLRAMLEPFGVPILSTSDLPPEPLPEQEEPGEPAEAPSVQNTCSECGMVVLARRRGHVLCDVCRELNRQLSPIRTGRRRAAIAGRGETVTALDEAIAQLEAQRPRPGGGA